MINKIEYCSTDAAFVQSYDKENSKVWDVTKGPVVALRANLRNHYLKEQKYCCVYCRMEKKEHHGLTWDVEHIVPKKLHPEFLFEPQNLAMSCKECNIEKGDRDVFVRNAYNGNGVYPDKSEKYKIFHPHLDNYSDHFEVSKIKGRRIYRCKNGNKAKFTYIACNFIRFDYMYSEWDEMEGAVIEEFSEFLNKVDPNSNPEDIKKQLRHFTIKISLD